MFMTRLLLSSEARLVAMCNGSQEKVLFQLEMLTIADVFQRRAVDRQPTALLYNPGKRQADRQQMIDRWAGKHTSLLLPN
jgi:hypothetical protein